MRMWCAVVLRQAQELHCRHAGLPLDLSRLQAPVRPGDPMDDSDVMLRMRAALPRPLEPAVAGALPTHHDMEQAVKRGPGPHPPTNCRGPRYPPYRVSACGSWWVSQTPLRQGPPAECSQRSSTSASPTLSRRGWCATAGPSCWSPTSGGWRRVLCRTAGSPAGSSGAPCPWSTSPIGGKCWANRWPWPAAGYWPARPSSTGRSGRTIGMR